MATEYGITDQGFVIKTLSVIMEEIDIALKEKFGNQINTLPESVFGQLKDIYAEREKLLWELMQDIYNSQYPNTASGVSLENVGDFNLLEKLEARASTIETQVLFGTASTVIPAGTKISVQSDISTIFETNTEVTLVAGVDEVQTIEFSATPDEGSITFFYNTEETTALTYDDVTPAATLQGYLRGLSGLSEVTVSGSFASDFVITFAGNDGKQEQPLLTEGTSDLKESSTPITTTITETTPGEYQGIVGMTCTETGIKNANAKTLTVIDNPITGFARTFNTEDATLGRDEETDPEFRLRRSNRLTTSQAGPVEAIKTHILRLNDDEYADLPQLTDVIVYENVTDVTDAKNMPPHSVMAVIRQEGDVITRDQEIAQAFFESKCAGIETSFGYAYSAKIIINVKDTETTIKINDISVTANSGGETMTKADIAAELKTNINTAIASVTAYYTASNEYTEVRSNPSVLFTIENVANCIISDENAVTKKVTDTMNIDHYINFGRPSSIDIYLGLYNFTTNSDYPTDGNDQLKTVLATWGNTLGVGQDIIVYPQLIAQIAAIPGITDFVVKIDIHAIDEESTDDKIDVSDGTTTAPEFSLWSTTNITITAAASP